MLEQLDYDRSYLSKSRATITSKENSYSNHYEPKYYKTK